MKRTWLFLIAFLMPLCLLPLPANAQSADSLEKSNDWKLGVGVTLLSNMTYSRQFQVRQPLEFDFRYKLGNRHTLRAAFPIAWKTKMNGMIEHWAEPIGEISLEDYLQRLHDDAGYNFFYKIMECYYNIYGISLGYDYGYSFGNALSLFLGMDLAYYYQYTFSKYYTVWYDQLNDDNHTRLLSIALTKDQRNMDVYSIKPFAGLRYKFQRLLLEANMGYYLSKYTVVVSSNADYILTQGGGGSFRGVTPFKFKKFIYSLSLYYTF
jgi:hypothetical protein